MIWFDRTRKSVVWGCRSCGTRDVATTQQAADGMAALHLLVAHPDPSADRSRSLTAARVRRYRAGQ